MVKDGAEKVAVEASIAHVNASKHIPPEAPFWQGRRTWLFPRTSSRV
jgi:hypothetical protein